MQNLIGKKFLDVQNDVNECAKNAGRAQNDVKLMAVSKFHSIEEIESAIKFGANLFGENRVQEAVEKFSVLLQKYPKINLHLIGSLQRNKVKDIVKIASCIESVDRIDLICEIEKQCAKIERKIDILYELHTAEESKSGFANYDELFSAVKYTVDNCAHIVPKGFMTMAAFTNDEALIKKSFVQLKTVGKKIQDAFPNLLLNEYSMGMSNDYKIAIQEGSTIVRIGTAIFGERNYDK